MQRDFIDDTSPIRVTGGKALVPNIVEAVQVCRNHGFTGCHDPLRRFRRHFYVPGKDCAAVKGSAGAEIVDQLVIEQDDYKLVKTRFSAFFNTHLHSVLQGMGIDNLVVAGVQTSNCIRQTVFDAVSLDYKSITVLVDATAAATNQSIDLYLDRRDELH